MEGLERMHTKSSRASAHVRSRQPGSAHGRVCLRRQADRQARRTGAGLKQPAADSSRPPTTQRSKREGRHFSYFAFEGATGALRWKHEARAAAAGAAGAAAAAAAGVACGQLSAPHAAPAPPSPLCLRACPLPPPVPGLAHL
jgi:hypothetical protein